MIIIKVGVSLLGCRAEILTALIYISQVFSGYGLDTVVTSGTEEHENSIAGSRHFYGEALDIRSKHIPTDQKKREMLVEMALRLGPDYTIVFEYVGQPREHYHVQWTPEGERESD